MKKTIRIAVTVILLLLAVSSLAVFALGLAENRILSWDAFRGAALDSGWNEGVRQRIREGFEPINDVTDIPRELTDAFLEEKITDDLCAAFWSEGRVEFPGEELKADLTERIRALAEQLREKGEIQVTEEEWADLVKSCSETADNYISVVRNAVMISKWSGTFKTVSDVWAKYGSLLLTVAGAVALVSSALLLAIHRKKPFQVLYAVLGGAGLTLLIPAVWLKAAGYAARLQITPAYLKGFLIELYALFTGRLLAAGAVLTALGAVCGLAALILWIKKPGEPEEAPAEEKRPEEKTAPQGAKLLPRRPVRKPTTSKESPAGQEEKKTNDPSLSE